MPCYKPLDGYKNLITGAWQFHKGNAAQKLQVRCNQCLGCRVDHASMWTIRIVQESHMHCNNHGNSWVTLTYRDPSACTEQQYKDGHFIPSDYSLRPSDVSKFIRSLRKANQDHKIRYFYCGEYGPETQRPHYHLCLFNHSFNDVQLFKDDEGLYTYTSPTLEKHWPHGFSTVAELNPRTAAYTAGYIFSKITGKKAQDHYLRCDEHGEAYWLLPEYTRMSTGNTKNKHQGLGASFYDKYKTDIFPSDESPVPGKGIVQQVPRYYTNILKSEDPITMALVTELRAAFIDAHRADYTPERLQDKYICAQARQSQVKRNLI